MDMEKLGYINAVDWFADIWEAVTFAPASEAESEQRPTTDSWGLDHPPADDPDRPAEEFAPLWDGRNWQDKLDSDIQSITDTEPRLLGTKSPICQDDFKNRTKGS